MSHIIALSTTVHLISRLLDWLLFVLLLPGILLMALTRPEAKLNSPVESAARRV